MQWELERGRSREQALGYRQEQGEDRDERMVHVRRNVGAESRTKAGWRQGTKGKLGFVG